MRAQMAVQTVQRVDRDWGQDWVRGRAWGGLERRAWYVLAFEEALNNNIISMFQA